MIKKANDKDRKHGKMFIKRSLDGKKRKKITTPKV